MVKSGTEGSKRCFPMIMAYEVSVWLVHCIAWRW